MTLGPDPDRDEGAMMRLLIRCAAQPEPREYLTAAETRVLQALSHGLDREGTAEVLGNGVETVKTLTRRARRALRAKNTTHACCEALRRGLIQ